MKRNKTTNYYILTRDKDGTLIVWPEDAINTLRIDRDGKWETYGKYRVLTNLEMHDGKPSVEDFTGTSDWSLPILTKQRISVTTISEVSSTEIGEVLPDYSE